MTTRRSIQLGILLLIGINGRLQAEEPDPLALYRGVTSVHMKSAMTINVDGRSGKGSFEYWAEGDKYHVRCVTDPALGLYGDRQHAFDGTRRYYLDDKRNLFLQTGDDPRAVTAVLNPFFLPANQLNRDADDCVGCVMNLADVQGKIRRLGPRTQQGIAISPRVGAGRIDWKREDGTPYFEVSYALDTQGFPKNITTRSFDEQGQPRAQIDYVIEVLELNQSIEPDAFQIAWHLADRVLDNDRAPDVKAMQLR